MYGARIPPTLPKKGMASSCLGVQHSERRNRDMEAAQRGTCRRAAACSRKAGLLALALMLLLVPASCGSDEAVLEDEGGARFPRFFNAKTMRVVGKEDEIPTDGYAAFIPAARPTYDARMDVSLPLARRINAGYRLPNVFRPGEWAPLRPFFAAPQQEENANGLLQSTRHSYQPVSWYTVLKAFFGIPPLTSVYGKSTLGMLVETFGAVHCLRPAVADFGGKSLCQCGLVMHPNCRCSEEGMQ